MNTNNNNGAYKVIVSGIVQGVGFRYFTAQQANQLNISGHAKNLIDGTVEVLMFGEQEKLQRLLVWLENGPKTARVDALDIQQIEYKVKVGFSPY